MKQKETTMYRRGLYIRFILVFVSLSAVLTGCDNVKKSLGLDHDPPDEFSVVTRAPISLPPDFNTLPTPQTPQHISQAADEDVVGAPDIRPQEAAPIAQAQKSLFGRELKTSLAKGKLTSGERAFVLQIQEQVPDWKNRPKDIQKLIQEETHIQTGNKKTWVKKLLFWQKDKSRHKEALNPETEYQKLYGTLPGEEGVVH